MIVLYVLMLGSSLPYLLAASLLANSNASDDIDKALEFGEAVEKEREALSERDQAVLEAIVDEAIRQEELLRQRRTSAISKPADERFSSYEHHETVVEEYGPPPIPTSYKDKSFSLWSFKKMVLNALLQAIKAIKGGVIALTGQIVKVKGHLVAAKGKLLETKGDAITEFGKHLATKALLTPVHVSNYDHNTPELEEPRPYPYPPYPPYIPYPGAMMAAAQMAAPSSVMPPNQGAVPQHQSTYAPVRNQEAQRPPVTSMAATLDHFQQFQTWPLSPLQVQALSNLYYPAPLNAETPPPPAYSQAAPYPAALTHSSYGSMSHSADYVGPPPTSYGSNNQHFNPTQLSHQYLPPPPSGYSSGVPSGFSSPSGPSYSNNFGGSGDHWNQRTTHKRSESIFPDGFHAGLIVLKPLKGLEPRNAYKTPKAFTKSSNSRTNDETATVKPNATKNVKT